MLRERITITVDADLLAAVDALVDKELLRNRSQAIEHLLKEGIGLHRLDRAFFFLEGWDPDRLAAAAKLCSAGAVRIAYLVGTLDQAAEAGAVLQEAAPALETRTVPGDFGSGGALLLKKSELEGPFLLIWPDSNLRLLADLAPAYVFHRQHGAPLTQLLAAQETAFVFAGCAIASPEILAHIPAGIAALESAVFPDLLKSGKVRGYPLSEPHA